MNTHEALIVLGLTSDWTEDNLKLAYRKKAKETHPDLGGEKEAFIAVREAYEFLCTKNNVDWKKDLADLDRWASDVLKEMFMGEFTHFEGELFGFPVYSNRKVKVSKITIISEDRTETVITDMDSNIIFKRRCPICNVHPCVHKK